MSRFMAVMAQVDELLDRASAENRELTETEKARYDSLIAQGKQVKKAEEDMTELGRQLGTSHSAFTDANASFGAGAGPGDRFIKSAEYLKVKDAGSRGQTWSTGPIQVSDVALSAKGTLLETTVGGPGGGVVPPGYEQGIASKLFEPLGVADVFSSSVTTASQIRYVTEGTATSGAAGVAEAGTKPESTLVMSEVTEPVKKIATVLPISDELLEDAPSIQSYLNSRLSLFVKIEEERQLLRGAGTNELVGLMNATRGINLYTRLGTDDNATALARVLANTAGSSFLMPDTIIMHPAQWLSTRLLRDGLGGTAGQFLGGGPFTGAYGNGGAQGAGLFGASLWNTRVVISSVVGAGTALVGNFSQGAHVWRKGGLTVTASDSHASFFIQDMHMLRAEERLALGVYRPSAFTAVSGMA
jgi:HK97 family phage major capsid protein